MPNLFRRIFTRKFFVRLAFVFLALLTLVVIFYNVEKWRGQRAWNAYAAAAQQRGVKLWLRDYVPAEIPTEDNYAALPFIDKIFRTNSAPPATELPSLTVEGKSRPKFGNVGLGPTLSLTEWRDFLLAAKAFSKPSADASQDMITLIQQLPVLQQLRMATPRPGCRFPTDWSKGISTPLPHLGPLRNCATLLHLSVSAHLAAGQPAAAAAELGHLFRLHEALRTEPSLIAGLVRLVMTHDVIQPIWEGLACRQWTEADLAVFERHLAAWSITADYRFAIGSERGFSNLALEQIVGMSAKERARMAGLIDNVAADDEPRSLQAAFNWYPSGWMRLSMVCNNEFFDDALAAFQPIDGREPTVIPARPGKNDWIETHINTSYFRRVSHAFSLLLLPALDAMENRFLETDARIAQARLACALERHRLAHGTFPEKLEALVPSLLPALPIDLCDGHPIRYRRTPDGGYELWSVALNRQDDHGDPGPQATKEPPDWLWRMPGASSK